MVVPLNPTVGVEMEYPGACTPLAAVTQNADTWDSATGAKYVTLTADSVRVDVSISLSAYLVFSDLTSAPAQNGTLFPAGRYEFKVRGPVYLHVKNGAAGQNVVTGCNCWTR